MIQELCFQRAQVRKEAEGDLVNVRGETATRANGRPEIDEN